jgi:hypothetical protein
MKTTTKVMECGNRCCSYSPYISSNIKKKEENESTSLARA